MDETRRSCMGMVISMNGAPISWTSTLGKTVATSTAEAEVNAAVVAAKDSLHLRSMLQELGTCPAHKVGDFRFSSKTGVYFFVRKSGFHDFNCI